MSLISEREKNFEKIRKLFKFNSLTLNSIKNGYIDSFKILNRIGSDSVYGEIYKACTTNNDICIAIKKIPITRSIDIQDVLDIIQHKSLKNVKGRVGGELAFLHFCNRLVFSGFCFHLPLTYKAFLSDNCNYEQKESGSCILIEYELFDGDLHHLIPKDYNNESMWITYVFQILLVLIAFDRLKLRHTDLHAGNQLYKKIPRSSNEYFYAKVDGKEYYAPNVGYFFSVTDFGLAFSEDFGYVHDPEKKTEVEDWGWRLSEELIEFEEILESKNKNIPYKAVKFLKNVIKDTQSMNPSKILEKYFTGKYLKEINYSNKPKSLTEKNIIGYSNLDHKFKFEF